MADLASFKLLITALKSPSAPYKIVPVENILGPTIVPDFTISDWEKTISVLDDGSCWVVIPKARLA